VSTLAIKRVNQRLNQRLGIQRLRVLNKLKISL
jgi:hypothetical protein